MLELKCQTLIDCNVYSFACSTLSCIRVHITIQLDNISCVLFLKWHERAKLFFSYDGTFTMVKCKNAACFALMLTSRTLKILCIYLNSMCR